MFIKNIKKLFASKGQKNDQNIQNVKIIIDPMIKNNNFLQDKMVNVLKKYYSRINNVDSDRFNFQLGNMNQVKKVDHVLYAFQENYQNLREPELESLKKEVRSRSYLAEHYQIKKKTNSPATVVVALHNMIKKNEPEVEIVTPHFFAAGPY